MRVAVIGAGPAGLVTLYTLERSGLPNLEIVCFEHTEQPGGEWIYTDAIGKDEFGLPVHSSMYKGLRTNLPKELMLLHPDFPWPKEVIDFPYREEVLEYFCNFANKFNLTKYMRFQHYVESISRVSADSNVLKVNVKDLKADSVFTQTFDYVVLCTGKHGDAYIPHDTSSFSGEALHYHDLKDHDRLKGKRVVVVGAEFGAMDMLLHLVDLTPALVLSYHTNLPFFGPLSGVSYKPHITKIDGNKVFFSDNSSFECDVLLYATGFTQLQPLSPELDLDWSKSSYFFPLYKHMVHPNCPSILFVGKAISTTIVLCHNQAEFVCQVIKGQIALPSSEVMKKEIKEFELTWRKKMKEAAGLKEFFTKVELEIENGQDVARMAGVAPLPPYLKKLFYSLVRHITSDLLNYQNYRLKMIEKDGGDYDFDWIAPEVRRVIKPIEKIA